MTDTPTSHNTSGTVLAVVAHPDDIEFMMSGTMMLLRNAGFRLHYMTVANGSCGTVTLCRDDIVGVRTEECREAASRLGAEYHAPLVDDIKIYYEPMLLAKLTAVVRQVQPTVLLLQSPCDYMEDHVNSSRLMVTAGFCRGMRNFISDPLRDPYADPMAVYHALPYGLCDQLRRPVRADFFVDVASVIQAKKELLACHRSQKEWLDKSQGLDSYIRTMEELCAEMGRLTGKCSFAEGWQRHSHLGFADPDFDPVADALSDLVTEMST